MPALNGTGPLGEGSRTGRGMGDCGKITSTIKLGPSGWNQGLNWGRRFFNATWNSLFRLRRGRGNRRKW
ncbi:MAG: DUF5320 domain-containing protein [Leptolinea sp.]|nr:DUF5320 domain-containing protein [Leptolinea sp.]